jgi:Spy/CpxP family protein refolding chaperone
MLILMRKNSNPRNKENLKMKKLSMIATLLLVLLFSTSALAGPRHRSFDRNNHLDPAVLAALNLTSEQTEKISALREAARKEITPIKAQFATKRAEMRLLWAQPTLDADKIKATQKELQALRTQIRNIQTDMRIAFRNLLTPEQTSELLATGYNKNFRFKKGGGYGVNKKGGTGRGQNRAN